MCLYGSRTPHSEIYVLYSLHFSQLYEGVHTRVPTQQFERTLCIKGYYFRGRACRISSTQDAPAEQDVNSWDESVQ